jgi:hypothetical protein
MLYVTYYGTCSYNSYLTFRCIWSDPDPDVNVELLGPTKSKVTHLSHKKNFYPIDVMKIDRKERSSLIWWTIVYI